MLAWMAWTWQTAMFFGLIALDAGRADAAGDLPAAAAAHRASCGFRPRAAIGSSSR